LTPVFKAIEKSTFIKPPKAVLTDHFNVNSPGYAPGFVVLASGKEKRPG
jgi:hypothetical protein